MTTAKRLDPGVVTISIDTELGWGNIHSGDYDELTERLDEGKNAIAALLDCLERYDIPATWAVVGQLCREWSDDGPPESAGPVLQDREVPWERDWWHAPELVERIATSPVGHEIGSHSANHLVYSQSSTDATANDLELFHSLASDYRPFDSFVFPQNGIAHLNLLKEYGFRCYRGRPPFLGTDPSPTVFRPRRDDDLVNVPASTALRHYADRGPLLSRVPMRVKRRLLCVGADLAVRREAVFHLVLHPIDFTLEDGQELLSSLETFLSTVSRRRDRGDLRTLTMGQVASTAVF